jgi:hypothetical protein
MVPRLDELWNKIGADEPGGAGQEYAHGENLLHEPAFVSVALGALAGWRELL